MYATKPWRGETMNLIIETKDRIRWYFEDTVGRWPQKVSMFIAWHLPHSVVMWCAVRVGAKYSTSDEAVLDGEDEVPKMTFMNALKHWG